MMHRTTLLKARQISESEVTDFAKSLQLSPPDMLLVQRWYPRIWNDWARDKDSVEPREIYSEEEDIEVQPSNGLLSFRDKKPSFADRLASGSPRWSNVFVFKAYGGVDEHAEVIPVGLPKLSDALGFSGFEYLRSGKGGLTLACRYSDFPHRCELPESLKIFEVWAKQHGYELSLSSAGKIAQQLLRQISGVWYAWLFADTNILKLFEKMARGAAISVGELRERLKEVDSKSPVSRLDRHVQSLVEKRVLRIGVELQCNQCQQRTWYPLEQLRESVVCEKCLETFSFPADQPPVHPWHYKTTGPFSVPGFCSGAYCVTFALRFFKKTLHGSATAIPSFTMKDTHGVIEADFGLFYRSNAWFDREPYLVFGECKTFDQFTEKDIRRMNILGSRFPGSVLVFCTLNNQLSRRERQLLSRLAMRGRKYMTGEKWRNPVLILTRIELFSNFPPDYAWRDAGGKFGEFVQQRPRLHTLPELCDATQQLHLGMESYWKTQEAWFERRRKKLAMRRASKNPTT